MKRSCTPGEVGGFDLTEMTQLNLRLLLYTDYHVAYLINYVNIYQKPPHSITFAINSINCIYRYSLYYTCNLIHLYKSSHIKNVKYVKLFYKLHYIHSLYFRTTLYLSCGYWLWVNMLERQENELCSRNKWVPSMTSFTLANAMTTLGRAILLE
jgi:hypothetical protein